MPRMGAFRFLHAADVHLDSPLRGLAAYDEAPVADLQGATRRALERLVDYAIEEEVAFVVIAGDLYDGAWKDYRTGLFFVRQLGRLAQAGIGVFVAWGNHDAESEVARRLTRPPNLHVFSSRKAETVELGAWRVALHGRSYGRRTQEEDLAATYPAPKPGWVNIGVLHTSLDGRPGHASYAPCKPGELRAKGYDYWALGHVHTHEVVSEDPWIVYPGCIQGRHIRESGPKGCVLVTVQDGRVADVHFEPLDVVRWETCAIDVGDTSSEDDQLAHIRSEFEQLISQGDGRLLAVRVVVRGTGASMRAWVAAPHQAEAQVRSAAEYVGPDLLWVEKVILEAERADDGSGVRDTGGMASSRLAEILDALDAFERPEDVAGFVEAYDALAKKVGSLAPPLSSGDGVRPGAGSESASEDADSRAVRWLAQARDLLRARLAAHEDATHGGD